MKMTIIFLIALFWSTSMQADGNSLSVYNCLSKSGRTNLIVKIEDEHTNNPEPVLVTFGIDGHFVNYTSNPGDLEIGHLYDLVNIDYDVNSNTIFVSEGVEGVLVSFQLDSEDEEATIERGFFDPRRFVRPRPIGPINLKCKKFVMHFE